MHLRLQTKLVLLITTLLCIIILFWGIWVEYILAGTLKEQIGTRALNVAETVAEMPDIKNALMEDNPSKIIQPIAEKIRKKTGAEFVIVGNKNGIRYSHPDPDRIGKEMEGSDNQYALQGKSIISEAVGSLGPSLRGIVPIVGSDNRVIGIVAVGFLLSDVQHTIADYRAKIEWLAAAALLLGLVGAVLIGRDVKRATLGLEPEEISRLYQEKNAILQSVHEGIIAINNKGMVTMINQTGLKLLGLQDFKPNKDHHISDILPSMADLADVIQKGKAEYDREMLIGSDVFIVNRVPIFKQSHVIGAVSSFRSKSEIQKLVGELSEVKRYTESLRAQTHEYSNKLYTILGLIQLESYTEAIELISREFDIHHNLLHFIMEEVPDRMVGGLLIGKFNRAKELKVELEIERESTFADLPASLDRSYLGTILGNLIDNAIEAVLKTGKESKRVSVFLTDIGDDLIIEVEDNGTGIDPSAAPKIFEAGYSTKETEGHGYGLALVRHAVKELGGHISFDESPYGGTIFTVVIPKETE